MVTVTVAFKFNLRKWPRWPVSLQAPWLPLSAAPDITVLCGALSAFYYMLWDLLSLPRKGLFSPTAVTRLREDFQVGFSCVFGEGEAFPEDWIQISLLFLPDCIVWGTWLCRSAPCEMGCLKITAPAHTVPGTRAGPWWELTSVRAPITFVRRACTF